MYILTLKSKTKPDAICGKFSDFSSRYLLLNHQMNKTIIFSISEEQIYGNRLIIIHFLY